MKKNGTNCTALLFQKVVSSGLVKEILSKSIYTVEAILRTDSQGGRNIESLDDPELYKLSLSSATKAFITNQECYRALLP